MPVLTEWSAFYTAIGSSAAALTGLMFVVITLVAGENRGRDPLGVATFSTPTVMHFCATLFLSLAILAPWHSLGGVAILLGLMGLYGTIYIVRVMYLTTRLDRELYVPDAEDWTWFGVLPLLGYGTVVAAAFALPHVPVNALFAIAGATVLLIFVGIRNSWDVVTYLAVDRDSGDE